MVDTDVISAGAPSKGVASAALVAWMDRNSNRLFLSTITIAEIEGGIAKTRREGARTKTARLTQWLETLLHLYSSRILPFDLPAARIADALSDRARSRDQAPGFPDLAIAATAAAHGLTVLTRNLRHFAPLAFPRTIRLKSCPDGPRFRGGSGIYPGFPFSQRTSNLLECHKSPGGRRFGCGRGDAEVARRWVRGKNSPFSSRSTPRLKVDFQGSRVTSDGGLLLVRELDERLGFGALIAQHLTDSRGKNTQLPLADLLRQSVYSRLAGYEDVNDAERLSQDPTFRLIGRRRSGSAGGADLPLAVVRDRTADPSREPRRSGRDQPGLDRQGGSIDSPQRVVLDMDSTEIPVYGQQEQSAYNGHFESTCYHPLLLFNREGDCLAAKLRPGNVHSAEGWEELLLPEIERQQQHGKEVVSGPTRLRQAGALRGAGRAGR